MLFVFLLFSQALAVRGHDDRVVNLVHSKERIVDQAEDDPDAKAQEKVLAITDGIILLHEAEKGKSHEGHEESDGQIVVKFFKEAECDQQTHDIRARSEAQAAAAADNPAISKKAHDLFVVVIQI